MKPFYVTCFLLAFLSVRVQAQEVPTSSVVEKISQYNTHYNPEKLYLSYDRSIYSAGDTIWYKAFLLQPDGLPGKSIRLYIELLDDKSKLNERIAIPLSNGTGSGYFPLPANLPEGNYALRAYTNYQQNFGSENFYIKTFSIGHPGDKSWLVASNQTVSEKPTGYNVRLDIQLTNLQKAFIGFKELDVSLLSGNNGIIKTSMQSDAQGMIHPDFEVSSKNAGDDLYLLIQDKVDKNNKIQIPVKLPKGQNIDLQFFPEGGYLLINHPSNVGFKAIAQNGMGTTVSGEILNDKNEKVTEFKDDHNGMGSFVIIPQTGETYSASLLLKDGSKKIYPLPIAKTSGTALKITRNIANDSLFISVRASQDKRVLEPYTLVAQFNKLVIFSVKVGLKNGFFNLKIPNKQLPSGILHFTLFSPESIALNERNLVTSLPEEISISTEREKHISAPGDSVKIDFKFSVRDSPISGTYLAAVTDNSQVSFSSEGENLTTTMFFSSQLKGYIEDPNWYFLNRKTSAVALDKLMLTQGWTGYNWTSVFSPLKPFHFIAETENVIKGKITNLFRGAMPSLDVSLLSVGKDLYFDQTKSEEDGSFIFKDLPVIDSAGYVVKIKNAKGKASASTINFEEFIPAPISPIVFAPSIPWYLNTDTIKLNYIKSKSLQIAEANKRNGITIKEVEINTPKLMKRVQGMTWDAVLKKEIDEKELKLTPKLTLYDLLRAKVPEFGMTRYWYHGIGKLEQHNRAMYAMGGYRVADVIMDGISTKIPSGFLNINRYTQEYDDTEEVTNHPDFQDYNQAIFNYVSAEDVKNIQYYRSAGYSFLVIQTRSGKGPFIKLSPGLAIYRPLPLQLPTLYYQPKYEPEFPENNFSRATVYWNSDITPDKNGHFLLKFLAPNKSGAYTIRLEGTSLLGSFGSTTHALEIR